MHLALGTVEFGMDYGIAAARSRPSMDEIALILDAAEDAGIDILDTAPSYGDAEDRLGQLTAGGTSFSDTGFKIITKAAKLDPAARLRLLF